MDLVRQRWYDPLVRFWWQDHVNHPLGQPYWLDVRALLFKRGLDPPTPGNWPPSPFGTCLAGSTALA